MKYIELSKNKRAVVDDSSFEELNKYKWYCNSAGYAVRGEGNKTILMHREITKCPDDLVVDHIDHNTLNNCINNLRNLSFQENHFNKKINKNNKSGFKGISWFTLRNKWRARIMKNGKEINIGLFENLGEAVRSYNQYAKRLFGDYAFLNKELE